MDRKTATESDLRRQLFFLNRESLRVASLENSFFSPTPLRKRLAAELNDRQSTFRHGDLGNCLPLRHEFERIRQQSKATIGAFILNLQELPIRQAVPEEREPTAPPAGTDMDFAPIEVDVRTRLQKYRRRTDEEKLAGRKIAVFPYSPPVARVVTRPGKWRPDVEENFRFQKAGYQDETYFRMLHGLNVKIPRWKHTGFIKSLPEKQNIYTLNFPSSRQCRLAQLGSVRLYLYNWRFLEHDFRRIALLQMRFSAVQKEATAHVEKERAVLVKQYEKEQVVERERLEHEHYHHRHSGGGRHHHQPVLEVVGGATTDDPPKYKKHKHQKKK